MEADQIIDERSSSHNPGLSLEADQIIVEGSSPHNPGRLQENEFAALLKAVRSGDWITTSALVRRDPAALKRRTCTIMGGTVLHAAVDAEQERIVERLVNMISGDRLVDMIDNFCFTALHLATTSGNCRIAMCLIKKYEGLVSVRNIDGELPVTMAMGFGHKKLARELYHLTPPGDLEAEKGWQGAALLKSCIYARDLDMALALLSRSRRLALAVGRRGCSPLEVLANSTEAFEAGKGMVFWKQWIYDHCIHISLDRAAEEFRDDRFHYGEEDIRPVPPDPRGRLLKFLEFFGIGSSFESLDSYDVQFHCCNNPFYYRSVGAYIWRHLLNFLGFKHFYEMKLEREQFQELLSRMCKAISTIPRQEEQIDITMRLIKLAISRGNFEFVYQLLKENPSLLWITDPIERRNMFHWAVVHRQHRIFSLAYNLKKKNYLLHTVDNNNNTMLHLAGMLPKYSAIDHIRGAALQMQREVQWFKEVESICPPSCKDHLNNEGLTARQLFTSTEHQEMRKDGEKWTKGTATSCTVVGTLIITIMFAAAFTIPGGNNQDTGLPIFQHDNLFKCFIVADSLSLFSASTSVLMFLGILTSRYAEEDFLTSLPRKMIIGIFALFFSIATMMIAFSFALLLMLSGKYLIVVPIIGLAGIPIILFVLVQFRLLNDMLGSTYGSGIFDRNMKSLF